MGVETLSLTDPVRFDPYRGESGARGLTLEHWYPAAPGTVAGGRYETLLRDGETPLVLAGRAARGAAPAAGSFPLVVLSHGYPGNRLLLGHFGEALAGRGYRVVSVDHPQSTYADQGPFGATLYHRPLDQRFVIEALAGGQPAAVIGYSMGGYGALVLAGGGVSPQIDGHEIAPPGGAMAIHRAPEPPAALRAVVAIGPWGGARGLWAEGALERIVPRVLVMAGTRDAVSDYAGMRRIAGRARARLLSFENAGHNAAAPFPAPAESHAISARLGWAPFLHYADPVWDTLRMNAVAQHFAAAFLDLTLKGEAGRAALLAPETTFAEEAGFGPERAAGLGFEDFGG